MFLRLLFCITSVCAFVATAPSARSAASDLTSVNLDKIERFRSAVDASNAPVSVLAFGDSVSESWLSPQTHLFEKLIARAGSSGYSLQNAWNKLMAQLGDGAGWSVGNSNWWSYHFYLPPAGSIYWTNYASTIGSITANRVSIFWVACPEGGDFNLSVSTNGGPWNSPLVTLSGHSPSRESRHWTVDLPRQPYRLRVDGVTGTNAIIGPRYLDTETPGIEATFLSIGGANLDNILSRPPAVLVPVLQGLGPRLIVWHMKELADIGESALSNHLDQLDQYWRVAAPQADVVYIGTPWEVRDTNSNYTITQNGIVRAAAVRHGRAYVDCMNPAISYEWMVDNGFMYDLIHPGYKANQFMADILWRELGFFALRRQRELGVAFVPGGVRLEWWGSPDLIYELQSSVDHQVWAKGPVIPGIEGNQAVTNALGGTRFFRLKIMPR